MDDTILSSLVNLFTLFASEYSVDDEKAEKAVRNYLLGGLGLHDPENYIDLHTTLKSFYDENPDLDKLNQIESVASKLRGKIERSLQGMVVLRLLEFAYMNIEGFDPESPTFKKVIESFAISPNTLTKYMNFVRGVEDDNVRIKTLDGDAGILKVLYLKGHGVILVTWIGEGKVCLNGIPLTSGMFEDFQQSSVLSGAGFQPIYFSTLQRLFDDASAEKEVRMCARNLNFRFDNNPGYGMHNLTFDLRGGELVAVMGGSGVGKSTLLSLLNGNLRPQSGSITINGHDIIEPEAKALIGFVPQDDLLIEELTVYENLWFTAKLCFEGLADEQIDSKVMSMLHELGLDQAKDLKVGSPLNKYISGGQRKRLNIALELIREPAILFLDEPTSGLSSSDTLKVVNLLKEQAGHGKLIVANIHQPSSDVYKLFDRLWLLDKGGYPIYDGNPIEAISYFKRAANYADNESATCPLCGTVNPEQILQIIDETTLDLLGHYTDVRKVTPQQWHEKYLETRNPSAEVQVSAVPHTDQKRPSGLKQLLLFLRRNVRTKITNLQYVLVTLFEAPVLAVICGLLTHYTPDSGVYTVLDNKNLVSYFFMAIIVSIFLGMSGSAEEIIKDRALLKREKFLSLSYGSYIWSKIIYMGGVCLLQTFLFMVVGNALMGISGTFFLWWGVLFISAFLSSLIGLLLSQCMNSVVAIYITIPLLLIPQILLCGLVVKFEDLTPNSETGYVSHVGDIIPSRWAFEALAVGNFTSNRYEKPYFELDKAGFEAMYYQEAFLYELRSAAEVIKDLQTKGEPEKPEKMELLKNELPRLVKYCGLPEYKGDYSYDSLQDCFDLCKKVLSVRRNKSSLSLDRLKMDFIRKYSTDSLIAVKKANYNQQLENLVFNRDTKHPYVVVNAHIVPRCDYIFLTPDSRWGRAPFYSGVKRIGDIIVPTVVYDMCVLVLMCIVCIVCLCADFPGKLVRKERN